MHQYFHPLKTWLLIHRHVHGLILNSKIPLNFIGYEVKIQLLLLVKSRRIFSPTLKLMKIYWIFQLYYQIFKKSMSFYWILKKNLWIFIEFFKWVFTKIFEKSDNVNFFFCLSKINYWIFQNIPKITKNTKFLEYTTKIFYLYRNFQFHYQIFCYFF